MYAHPKYIAIYLFSGDNDLHLKKLSQAIVKDQLYILCVHVYRN